MTIGQKLETEECGNCTITNIYRSIVNPTEMVFELTVDEGQKFYFPETEITPV